MEGPLLEEEEEEKTKRRWMDDWWGKEKKRKHENGWMDGRVTGESVVVFFEKENID